MTKLKVGDKCKVIKHYSNDPITKDFIGQIVTVIDNDKYTNIWITCKTKNGDELYFNEEELELIKDKKVKGVSKNPKQFRLLKDSVMCKKGMVFEFDGVLYRSINTEKFDKYYNGNDYTYSHYEVENQSEWFEEILEEPKKESREIELPKDIEIFNFSLQDWIKSITEQVNKLSKEK